MEMIDSLKSIPNFQTHHNNESEEEVEAVENSTDELPSIGEDANELLLFDEIPPSWYRQSRLLMEYL